ncbi:mycothione reductase [Ornithinimicrobium cryptoxanthini]|uniref:Mycothione reductase n=1 Tax=Ornithinimicrobium cryptoxanthini TaxID=2934161 RepID=A0ABY4YG01_9MICO|nr:mycothione reductase [Ornithinimicrobium cryptoxanthini]USQ75288.1 mycothione reductase [Ornithinimicrobium cryptoxanthini]
MADYDLIIIGTGSGNSLVTEDFADKKVAVIERGIFGGTCLNVGCIPTKMFVYAAEVATTIRDAARFGVDATLDGVRWPDIRDRVFGRIDPISDSGRDYRVSGPHTTAYLGQATFVGEREVEVEITRPGGAHAVGQKHRITGDQVVIATGSRATIPEVIESSGVPYETSDTVMRLPDLPRSMAIIGGGVIGAEFAHVFSALGVQVTQVQRGDRLLHRLDAEVGTLFTQQAQQQWDLRLNTQVVGASRSGTGVRLELSEGSPLEVDVLLIATGRAPNSDGMGLEVAGVQVRPDGRVQVDEHGRTTAGGVWALGDVSAPVQLKHLANHEARVVAHNLVHPDDLRSFAHTNVPAAVFSHPQVAMVGLTEEAAREAGHDITVKLQRYGDTAYGWAMEDTTGVVKLIGDASTGLILGAHFMGPHASTLIQTVIHAMSFGQTAEDVARDQFWIHPALAEVVENALLGL